MLNIIICIIIVYGLIDWYYFGDCFEWYWNVSWRYVLKIKKFCWFFFKWLKLFLLWFLGIFLIFNVFLFWKLKNRLIDFLEMLIMFV